MAPHLPSVVLPTLPFPANSENEERAAQWASLLSSVDVAGFGMTGAEAAILAWWAQTRPFALPKRLQELPDDFRTVHFWSEVQSVVAPWLKLEGIFSSYKLWALVGSYPYPLLISCSWRGLEWMRYQDFILQSS